MVQNRINEPTARTQAGHTPGFWSAVFEDDPRGQPVPYYCGLVCIIADGDKRISVVSDNGACAPKEWVPNANLIAAAPELLAALQAIADESVFNQQRFAEDDDTDYFLRCFRAVKERARAAIAKAVEP